MVLAVIAVVKTKAVVRAESEYQPTKVLPALVGIAGAVATVKALQDVAIEENGTTKEVRKNAKVLPSIYLTAVTISEKPGRDEPPSLTSRAALLIIKSLI